MMGPLSLLSRQALALDSWHDGAGIALLTSYFTYSIRILQFYPLGSATTRKFLLSRPGALRNILMNRSRAAVFYNRAAGVWSCH